MQFLFLPAIALLDRMNFAVKFFFIGFVLLAPFAYTTHVMTKNLDKQIVFNQKESYGVEYITPGYRLLRLLEDCRVYDQSLQLGDASCKNEYAASLANLDALISEIDVLDRRFQEDFKTESGEYACTQQWNEIKADWKGLRQQGTLLQAGANQQAYNALCSKVTDWILNYSANFSNLILDPDLDSYWLMDAYVAKLPLLSEDIVKIATLAMPHDSNASTPGGKRLNFMPSERVELAGLYADAVNTINAFESVNIKTAYAFNESRKGTLRAKIDPVIADSIGRVRDFLGRIRDQYLLVEGTTSSQHEIRATALACIESIHALHQKLGPELNGLINDRVVAYQKDRWWGMIAAEGATFLLVYIFIAFYLAVKRSVVKLKQYTSCMIAGTSEKFDLGNKDEIGHIAVMYNQINSELNQVRALKTLVEKDKIRAEEDKKTAEELAQKLSLEMAERERAQLENEKMEIQLRNAQKLESIGQLAAGIAHEINTPIQYVGDNVRFLKTAFEDMNDAIPASDNLLKAVQRGNVSEAEISKVQDALKKADVEYLSVEIPKAVSQTLEGIDRVSKLVCAMKEFSHPGTKEKVPTNINKAIETTLVVSRNEYKYLAELVTEFDPALPQVPLFPGEFNQVVLNLIVNAAHAISDAGKQRNQDSGSKGTIKVKTYQNGNMAEIRISDTGTGIPEHVQSKIFDPFFTTKEIGRGTGQGLTIARSIVVDKHGGSLNFETEIGKGTAFIIRLPLETLPVEAC